jgi:UDP-N-acetylglucosamine--N-acetylmuramyl-(pentapeptide) pyrophosphoryl-undecaprenol N-acetylglucosamine transferase
MTPCIVFTGGGTAGHVTPNLALIHELKTQNIRIEYIGSKNGVEKELVNAANLSYHGISSGKLRRYFSWQNFVDPVKILYGILQAYFLLNKLKADIVFSKGGFVAFPVVVAAWLKGIPVIIHESDISPGLANRLSFPFANKICLTTSAATKYFKNQKKIEVTGTPIRQQLFHGSRKKGRDLCSFKDELPCLLIMGGSQGAAPLNQVIRNSLGALSGRYQVIHLCGKGKLDEKLLQRHDYRQFEYVSDELADLLAASDLIISRSGANSLYEILALAKPHILIPLPAKISRGDQIQNANYFAKQGISKLIADEQLTEETLLGAIAEVTQRQDEIVAKMKALNIKSATEKIIELIQQQLPRDISSLRMQ